MSNSSTLSLVFLSPCCRSSLYVGFDFSYEFVSMVDIEKGRTFFLIYTEDFKFKSPMEAN